MSYLDDPRAFWAAERTLLAWIRTQIAFLALAVLIAKVPGFLTGEADTDSGWGRTAMVSLVCGTAVVCAILSACQFHLAISKMGPQELPSPFAPPSLRIPAWLNLLLVVCVSLGIVLTTL
jgi:putative membrane protein